MKKFKCFVLFLVCFGLTLMVFGGNKSKLISNSANDTIATFTMDTYDFERVQTPQGEAVIIKAPHAGRIMETGAPDLPKFSAAVIIPDRGKMGIEVIDGQYTEIENVMIAPSKGNLLRTQDPNLIPYVYGKEYKKDAFYPGTLAELNKPYIARDFRGQAALIYPFQYNPVTGTLRVYSSITVRVNKKGNTGENEFNRDKPLKMDDIVRDFKDVYSRHFINFDAMAQAEASLQYTTLNDPVGRMLIVCYSGFMSNMAPFVTYKQSIGYTVDLVDYSTIGSSAALKTYVANYYNTNGLTYLLLVGDNAQVPVSSTTAGDSDNNYGYIVGTDHYQDIFIGRFSAETTAHVDTMVSRTIYYERDLSSSATWFRQATGMASNEGPGHNSEYDATHMNNIMSDLAGDGYTTSTNYQDGGSAANLSTLINAGKGTLWYCGHGNIDGWYCGWTFLNAQVAALTNDNMLPAIFSVACQVGNFKTNACFCEYWIRETNGSNPAGAIAICGSTINQSWNPPMDAQDEMSDLLVAGKRTFGGVFVNGMFKMNDLNSGTTGTDMTDTWICFGDSSVQLRTPGTPDGPGGGGPTAPIANFSGNPLNVAPGGSVQFTDTSTGTPTSWSWTFEGGTPATSTAKNPLVTYNTAGIYDVSLTAINAQGSDSETKLNYITVEIPPADDIAEAVDYTATFTKSGNANWARVTDIYYNLGDSAKSGTITHSQSCSIETSITVTSNKTVKFYWKVSSEASYDYLRFYIDGVQKNQIAGTVDWTQVSNALATGTHTLKWTYSKDASVSTGSDCGWVDKLEIVDGTIITYCASQGNNQADEWISRVRIGTLDKSSTASPYSDFTSIVTNYTRGASQSVTLTPGFSSSSYTEYWCVWIDYNKNGVFTDTGESVFSKSGSAAVTGSFTVSSSASTGNTRMRVSMKYGAAPTSCETFTYGEVEDYTANIL